MATKKRKKTINVVEAEPSLKVVLAEISEKLSAVETPLTSLSVPETSAPAVSNAETSSTKPEQIRFCDEPNFQKFQQLLKQNPWILVVSVVAVPLAVYVTSVFKAWMIPVTLVGLFIFAYQEIRKFAPARIRNSFERWILRLPYAKKIGSPIYTLVSEIRPFFLFSIMLYAGPFIILWMAYGFLKKLFFKKESFTRADLYSPDKIIIEQSVSKPVEDEEDANFYHSPAFAVTLLAVFALGLPTLISLLAYNFLGIDALLGFPSRDPKFNTNILLIGFYISSFGWCLSTLFFRAWFTYPLNFYSNEYDVVLDHNGIDKQHIKGWFAELLWFCYPEYLPTKFEWKDLHEVKFTQGGFGRLYPLPSTLFSSESIVYKVMNSIAAFTDAVVDRVGRCDYIEVKTAGAVAKSIKFRLWQMNKEDRARVFYALRKWAPSVVIPENVQQILLGSTALAETRYTQIWFDLLTSKGERQRKNLLEAGDSLNSGAFEVLDKIDSGGQANIYLAKRPTGERVVLKEFILTGDDDLGDLIESAADFENEGSILSRLEHSNVVKLHQVFTEDRRVYLVLEHVEGISLRNLIAQKGPVSEEEAVRLGLEMCNILKYLHSIVPPIVHRDFTPDNLILMNDGTLKVIDFSVAGSSSSIKDGDCVGKHSYTPAEQFRGQPCPQSDLYALGATLYFLTVGSDPPPITQLHPVMTEKTLSNDFDSIVAKLTSNSLAERYETAAWLELELKALEEKSYIIV